VLAERYVAPMLWHHNLAECALGTHNSFNKDCIQITSAVVLARDLYSASVLDLDTLACFLVLQLMRLEPKNIANPPVDR
jgi:hypothetical protein